MLPIVLHHGLFGAGEVRLGPVRLSYFRGIDRAIADRGHPLIITRVHPTSSIENRARQLKEAVLRQLRAIDRSRQKVIFIAHSLGGLDARYAVSKLGLAEHVAAVVTISTPHRGSPFADWVVSNLGHRLRGRQLVKFLGLDMRAIDDLTTTRCAEFNEQVLDMPGVQYFSVSASRPRTDIAPFAVHPHRIVFDAEGENDGLVSVKSATWGNHLTTWPADHWQVINRRYRFERKYTGPDIIKHWMELVDHIQVATGADNG